MSSPATLWCSHGTKSTSFGPPRGPKGDLLVFSEDPFGLLRRPKAKKKPHFMRVSEQPVLYIIILYILHVKIEVDTS
jgi:hypothetical protein